MLTSETIFDHVQNSFIVNAEKVSKSRNKVHHLNLLLTEFTWCWLWHGRRVVIFYGVGIFVKRVFHEYRRSLSLIRFKREYGL